MKEELINQAIIQALHVLATKDTSNQSFYLIPRDLIKTAMGVVKFSRPIDPCYVPLSEATCEQCLKMTTWLCENAAPYQRTGLSIVLMEILYQHNIRIKEERVSIAEGTQLQTFDQNNLWGRIVLALVDTMEMYKQNPPFSERLSVFNES